MHILCVISRGNGTLDPVLVGSRFLILGICLKQFRSRLDVVDPVSVSTGMISFSIVSFRIGSGLFLAIVCSSRLLTVSGGVSCSIKLGSVSEADS